MDPRQLEAIERWNLVFSALLVIGALALFDMRVVLGVTVGAIISCANFYGVRKLLERSLRGGRGSRAIRVLLGGKLLALMVVLFLAIQYLPLSPVGLAVGLSVFLLSIGAETVRFALRSCRGGT